MDDHPAPAILPVFPLTGSLLLPGNFLPLNIFEPRYRSMVEDAMAGARFIGMVQPVVPRPDNWGPVVDTKQKPELYSVGCAGRIEQCEAQPDGRFLIVLRGVGRFRIREELGFDRMYRCVRAEYDEFLADLKEPGQAFDPSRLLAAAKGFSRRLALEFDMNLLRSLNGAILLNALCAALPFGPAEKQALLEAPTLGQRQALLLELMEMGVSEAAGAESFSPPTIH